MTTVHAIRTYCPQQRLSYATSDHLNPIGTEVGVGQDYEPHDAADMARPANTGDGTGHPEFNYVPGANHARLVLGPQVYGTTYAMMTPNPFSYYAPLSISDSVTGLDTETIGKWTTTEHGARIDVKSNGGGTHVLVEVVAYYAVACLSISQAESFGSLESTASIPPGLNVLWGVGSSGTGRTETGAKAKQVTVAHKITSTIHPQASQDALTKIVKNPTPGPAITSNIHKRAAKDDSDHLNTAIGVAVGAHSLYTNRAVIADKVRAGITRVQRLGSSSESGGGFMNWLRGAARTVGGVAEEAGEEMIEVVPELIEGAV
jgi:hypothetical protein